HLDQRRSRAWGRIETAEQLRAQRFRRLLHADQVLGNRVGSIGVCGLADGVGRGREGLRQHIEKLFALALAERLVAGERFAGERYAGDLAVLAEQRLAEGNEAARVVMDLAVRQPEQAPQEGRG